MAKTMFLVEWIDKDSIVPDESQPHTWMGVPVLVADTLDAVESALKTDDRLLSARPATEIQKEESYNVHIWKYATHNHLNGYVNRTLKITRVNFFGQEKE